MTELTADIVATMPCPVLVLNQDFSVVLANEAFCDSFGVSSEEVTGRALQDLAGGQCNVPKILERLENVRDRGTEVKSYPVEHEFGTLGPRTILVSARKLSNVGQILLAIEDVTERRNAARALEGSEARLRDILETEAVGVLFFDEAGSVIGANDAFLSMTGYSRDELESGDLHWRKLTPEEWVALTEVQLVKLAETGRLGPYEKEYVLKDGSRSWMHFVGKRLGDGTIVQYCLDINERKRAERERELLAAELSHRVKNTLAVVQALAAQTDGSFGSVAEYRKAFIGRLHALASAHDALIGSAFQSVDMKCLIELATEAFRVDHPALVELVAGDPVNLTARQAQGLMLVLHELGTNAAKYGALSRHEGRLHISWTLEQREDRRDVHLEWRERHGPTVSPPSEKGFGSKLIERACAYELDGEAELDYAPEGLTCRIAFPFDQEES